jgi:Rrf2 family iron-sulfur cluster assembly transcriptional regulator
MSPYGKVAQAAISATSLLAEHYDSREPKRFNSADIAKARMMSQALVAKVLTILSQAGIVIGAPGPGGGYTLARPPEKISLKEIVSPFERLESEIACPFGDGWCGVGPQCPLHAQLSKIQSDVKKFLKTTTLKEFRSLPPRSQKNKTK